MRGSASVSVRDDIQRMRSIIAQAPTGERDALRRFIVRTIYGFLTQRGVPEDDLHDAVRDQLRGMIQKYDGEEEKLETISNTFSRGGRRRTRKTKRRATKKKLAE